MSVTDIKSMFESIKASLNVEKAGNSFFRDFLKMETGKTYLVRFLPNIKDPKSTFFHYSHHGFTSLSTGQYVDATCPRSFGERCPICEERFKLYKTKKEEDRNLAYMIRTHDKHLVNVYVINDPTTADNEGQVKILRFGKRIYDKITDATEGDDADEFGERVYDLSENGCNFKIKVETSSENNRKFTNYNNSRFTAPCAIPNMTPEKVQEIYKGIFDLTKILEMKSEDELKNILKTHVFCENANKPTEVPLSKSTTKQTTPTETEEVEDVPVEKPTAKVDSPENDKMKQLLDGLDSL